MNALPGRTKILFTNDMVLLCITSDVLLMTIACFNPLGTCVNNKVYSFNSRPWKKCLFLFNLAAWRADRFRINSFEGGTIGAWLYAHRIRSDKDLSLSPSSALTGCETLDNLLIF